MNGLDRLKCEQVFKKLDDYIDKELDPAEMELIREHLEICAWCTGAYEFQAEVLTELESRLQRIPVPVTLRDRVAAALRRDRESA